MNDTARIVADRVREYSDTFGRAFHAKDATLLRPYCSVPSTSVGRGRIHVMETEAQSDERWTRALAGLPEDYDHSVLHTVEVMMMSAGSAFVTVDCGRFNTRGEEYARFWGSYVLVEADDGWKITSWMGHEPGRTPARVTF